MDTIFIRELRLETLIGVYPWERQVRQTLFLDLDMAWDIGAAAAQDNLTLALDYAAVAEGIAALVQGLEFQLIETLAEAIASYILQEFKVPWLRLALHKPGAVLAARTLGVEIQRGVRPV